MLIEHLKRIIVFRIAVLITSIFGSRYKVSFDICLISISIFQNCRMKFSALNENILIDAMDRRAGALCFLMNSKTKVNNKGIKNLWPAASLTPGSRAPAQYGLIRSYNSYIIVIYL